MAPLIPQPQTADRSPRATPKPIKRFLDYLFVECGLAGNTVAAYQADLCEFWNAAADNGDLPATLDIEDVQRHLIELRNRGLSTASIARHLAAVKMFLRYHHQSDRIDHQHGLTALL